MSDDEWNKSFARCLGVYLSGEVLNERDDRGCAIADDNFLLLFNADHEEIRFTIAKYDLDTEWEVLLDTDFGNGLPSERRLQAGTIYPLQGRSVAMLVSSKRSP
jgi:glycogen operon protein